jgi:peptidoglycan hydrolase-like protein with peptidoglycan-binding domain
MSEIIDSISINPILEVQYYLKEISKYKPEIIIDSINGIYDSKTKDAVEKFQQLYGLPPNGIIDLATWSKLIYEYNKFFKMKNTPNMLDCFPSNISEVKLGDEKNIVYIIQILINNMEEKFKNYNKVNITGIYDQETESEIKKFQAMNKLPITGAVDVKTWNSLSAINNVCKMHES